MNKRLIILFIALIVVVVLVVLFAAVFILRDIEVTPYDPEAEFAFDTEKIIEDSRLETGMSIFNVSAKIAKENVEYNNPMLGVAEVVRKVNKVVFYIFEREPLFISKIKKADGSYEQKVLILDKELKILEVAENESSARSKYDINGFKLKAVEGHFPPSESELERLAGRFFSMEDFRYKRLADTVDALFALEGGKPLFGNVTKVNLLQEDCVLYFPDNVQVATVGTETVAQQVSYLMGYYAENKGSLSNCLIKYGQTADGWGIIKTGPL